MHFTFPKGWSPTKSETNPCPFCSVAPGQLHEQWCMEEQCPRCGWFLFDSSAGSPTRCRHAKDWFPADEERIPWQQEHNVFTACVEFGLFAKQSREDGSVPCPPEEPSRIPHYMRLFRLATWEPVAKRFILPSKPNKRRLKGKTNLTKAFQLMRHRGLIAKEDYCDCLYCAAEAINRLAWEYADQGQEVLGFVFYDERNAARWEDGEVGRLTYGQPFDPQRGRIGLAPGQVGKIVCECLARFGLRFDWDETGSAIGLDPESIVQT
jgi:hypothetical protein